MTLLKDIIAEDFQLTVEDILDKNNSSLLNIISELDRSASRLQRSMIYSATRCGCISISSQSGVQGRLCKKCLSTIENELGGILFSSAALASVFDISIYDAMLKEKRYLELLGEYLYL